MSVYIDGPIHSFYLLLFIWSFLKLATGLDKYCEDAVDCLVVHTVSSSSVFHISFHTQLQIIWVGFVNRRQMEIGCQVVILKRRSFIAFFKMHDIKNLLK